jgi:hypothetical protein
VDNQTEEIVPAKTKEILSMLRPVDDNDLHIVGRMSSAADGDISDFDLLPRKHVERNPDDDGLVENPYYNPEVDGGEELAGEPGPFSSPIDEQFPVFASALRKYQSEESPRRAVRLDTGRTYDDFVCESAVRELDRRTRELRDAVEAHSADHHGGEVPPMRQWDDVIGAIESAQTADEAREALPQVPLDVPDYARGKVHCWRDGDAVVCSIHFAAADGSHRVATTSAQPAVDADEITRSAMQAGVDPATVLGMVGEVADAVCGKKLMRDLARAALKTQGAPEVLGMSAPMVVASGGEGTAPLAALMYLQQECDRGNKDACREMKIIEAAANTPSGRAVAMPILDEAKKRLAVARAEKKATVLGDGSGARKLLQSYWSQVL